MGNWKRAAAGMFMLLAQGWAGAAATPLPAQRPSGELVLAGSTTMAPLMTEIAKRFESRHRDARIMVRGGGSGLGISDLRQGRADIGMVSRVLGEAERDLHGVPIARDGVTVIVHKDNPVQALSDEQMIDIFTGRAANWKEVGGRDAPVLVLAGGADRGSSELFAHYLGIKYRILRPRRLIGDNAQRIRTVAGTPNAVIYVSVGEAERNAAAGAAIKLLPVGGVAATSRNVRRGSFPISRPLTLVIRELPEGLAKDFIEFALSSEVTDLILSYDFVPYLD